MMYERQNDSLQQMRNEIDKRVLLLMLLIKMDAIEANIVL